jgi:hypothetical protein
MPWYSLTHGSCTLSEEFFITTTPVWCWNSLDTRFYLWGPKNVPCSPSTGRFGSVTVCAKEKCVRLFGFFLGRPPGMFLPRCEACISAAIVCALACSPSVVRRRVFYMSPRVLAGTIYRVLRRRMPRLLLPVSHAADNRNTACAMACAKRICFFLVALLHTCPFCRHPSGVETVPNIYLYL